MTKKYRRRTALASLVAVVALAAWSWRGWTTFPVGKDGLRQSCKVRFISMGTKTKRFLGDSIELGTAKLTEVVGGPDGTDTFTVTSNGDFSRSSVWMNQVIHEVKGRMTGAEAQRIFEYIARKDLLAIVVPNDAAKDSLKTLTIEANGDSRTIYVSRAGGCDLMDETIGKIDDIYQKSRKYISSKDAPSGWR